MAENGEQILQMSNISKSFGGVHALEDVNFDLNFGEVHALVGENGAGKSTLVKVLGGIIPRNAGRIVFDGQEVEYHRPIDALEAGISIIHQELSLMPQLNVIENMYMGRMKSRMGILNWRDLRRQTLESMSLINLDVDPNAIVRDLTISQRQLIEIARSLAGNAKLIVMDEPNSSLSESESEVLFEVIENLKERSIAIIYVSHKIEEVLRISDRISVLRDGKYVGTLNRDEANEQKVINMMVGRELDRTAQTIYEHIGEKILEVHNLTGRGFQNVSFDVNKGEIVAFSGLVGAGRSEVNRAIFGADKFEEGEIIFNDRSVRFKSPAQAIKSGIAMVPEDRKVLSLFTNMKILKNMSMAELPHMTKAVISERKERDLVDDYVEKLDIRLASIDDPVSSLSGGNQQKTVLGRWLATDPKLLILDEPTHGVDIGAKAEIYELMRRLAEDGMAIILISSELPEVLALANRIVIMHEGRVTGIMDRDDATEETVMAFATGLADDYAVKEAAGAVAE